MLSSIWEDIKREFRHGNMVTRLIIVNVVFFLAINIVSLIITLTSGFEPNSRIIDIIQWFSLSSDPIFVLKHPWVIITNMFLHYGFLHFLFNMLFLYWFGRIVGDLLGNQRILPIYLLGGLAGGFIYMLVAKFIYATGSYAYGASAAVMAIVVAAGTTSPDYSIRLLFLGDVKLKYIVLALIFLDLIGIANLNNTGGHFAHLGGALLGFLFVRQLRNGSDWAVPVNSIIGSISDFFKSIMGGSSKKGPKVVYRNPDIKRKQARKQQRAKGRAQSDTEDLSHQEQLDSILDKIKRSGYSSLSEEEKEFLFNASKK